MVRPVGVIRGLAEHVPGAGGASHLLARHYRRRCYRIYRWQTSVSAEAERRLADSGLSFREATDSDRDQMRHMDTWRDWQQYARWLDEGRRLLVAVHGETIVSYSWLDFRPEFRVEQVPEIVLRLAPDACFSDEAYTPPAFRGRGYRRLLYTYELLTARRHGKRFVVSYFLKTQAAIDGLRNFERIGIPRGEHIMSVMELRLVGRRFVWHKNVLGQKTVETIGRIHA